MTGLYGAELGVFATHQRRQKGLQAPSATDGQDTVPVSVRSGPPGTQTQGVVHTGAKSLPRAFAAPKSDRLLARIQQYAWLYRTEPAAAPRREKRMSGTRQGCQGPGARAYRDQRSTPGKSHARTQPSPEPRGAKPHTSRAVRGCQEVRSWVQVSMSLPRQGLARASRPPPPRASPSVSRPCSILNLVASSGGGGS